MAIDIKFDLVGNPEPPTIILATRNGNKLGQLNVDSDSISLIDKFNDASELTFTLNKYIDGELTPLWDKVVNFKLVYCEEWDCWFEITVELDEDTETIKTVLCTQLGQAELSQINLYSVELNTEDDIARDDYKVSILYDKNEPKASILNRMLEKAPHYSIAHVDSTIAKIQRSFSFDNTSIYDAFQEIAEEIGCLFVFHSNSDENGKIKRAISVYDLQQNCIDCGHRGEFINECQKCGSKNIINGYGEDTLIFVTSDELATEGIQLVADTDAVKNCFKLEAGDDLMTATVRNCNPNGTDYIWCFSDVIKDDMTDDLVKRLESYDESYKYYYNEYEANISDIYYLIDENENYLTNEKEDYLIFEANANLIKDYNALVSKYSVYKKDLQEIVLPIKGYMALMNAYYNTIDLNLYLKSGLMPSVEMSKTDAKKQSELLTSANLSPVAVSNIKIASLATVNSAVLAMAKIVVKPTYKVQINESELIEQNGKKLWRGNFSVVNYSDEDDNAISNIISVEVNDDIEIFIKQKLNKTLSKEDVEDLSISGLFKMEYNNFCDEIKKYALNPLISFREACQACIDILIEQGVSSSDTWSDVDGNNLYEALYVPYYNKLKAIESEIAIRENEINIVTGAYDLDGNIIADGLQIIIERRKKQIQDAVNFEKYLGNELWLEFCAYLREDKYSNDNYISDGLDNAELFKRALEFIEVANNEIYKASKLQHSISTTLNNLLTIPKFKPLINSFKVGNWIRVQVDNEIYKLRLLEYEIDYNDFNTISVEFSDVIKVNNSITDIESVLSQASSMATSYSSVKRQANQGEKSNDVLSNWFENGLNATNTKIIGANNQSQILDKNGFLCRQYDPITETYSDEQLKIINSTLAITDNNWETTKAAIGKYYYIDPITKELKSTYGVNGETIVGKILISERLDISNDNGNLQFGTNGLVIKNDVNSVSIDPNNESIFNIKNNNGNILSLDDDGELVIVGNITAKNLTLLDGTTIETGNITGLSDVAISGEYEDLSGTPTKLSDFTNDTSFITKDVDNLDNYYKKSEVNNLLESKANVDSLSSIATSGLISDAKDIESFKSWVLEQIQAAIR